MSDKVLAVEDSSRINRNDPAFNPRWLSRLAQPDTIAELVVRLGPRNEEAEPLVWTNRRGHWYTGRYIGDVRFEDRVLQIRPRLDFDVLGEWLAEVLNLAAVPDFRGRLEEGPFLDQLLAIAWGSALVRASKHGLPYLRRPVRHVGYAIRGRPLVRETVARRARGQPQLVSETAERDLDNPIVRTAVAAYEVLHRRLAPYDPEDSWLPDRSRDLLPAMMRACGTRPSIPSSRTIRRIRYTPITESYRPFVRLSEQIARKRGGLPDPEGGERRVTGLLLDVAELWELFVFHTARAALSRGQVIHGTTEGEGRIPLAANERGDPLQSLFPDVLIQQRGQTDLVVDAKYKRLQQRRGGRRPYDRHDLYQLITYLEEIDSAEGGILVYPEDGESVAEEEEGPWVLQSGQWVHFLSLPCERESARRRWEEIFSGRTVVR